MYVKSVVLVNALYVSKTLQSSSGYSNTIELVYSLLVWSDKVVWQIGVCSYCWPLFEGWRRRYHGTPPTWWLVGAHVVSSPRYRSNSPRVLLAQWPCFVGEHRSDGVVGAQSCMRPRCPSHDARARNDGSGWNEVIPECVHG